MLFVLFIYLYIRTVAIINKRTNFGDQIHMSSGCSIFLNKYFVDTYFIITYVLLDDFAQMFLLFYFSISDYGEALNL